MPSAWINFPTPTEPGSQEPSQYDNYTHLALRAAAKSILTPAGWDVVDGPSGTEEGKYDAYVVDYDLIPFERLLRSRAKCSSYVIRKALIRKHHLSHALRLDAAKRNERSHLLARATPKTWDFELQFADELDELLMDDLYDLQDPLEQGRWFILKPGMADRGRGIRLFNSLDTLRAIFEQYEMEDLADDEGDDEEAGETDGNGMLGQLRHFVVQVRPGPCVWSSADCKQEYLSNPLLLSPMDTTGAGRKFHLRAYVLCVGALQVYLWDEMLALFAPIAYSPPDKDASLDAHLTNTCRQEEQHINGARPKEENVHLWSDLALTNGPAGQLTQQEIELVRQRAAQTIGLVFEAAARGGSVHFQLWPNAFEVFGVDLLVDADLNVQLLEVNAQPDFAQTGQRLVGTIERLFERTLQVALLGQDAKNDPNWSVGESKKGLTLCLNEQFSAGH